MPAKKKIFSTTFAEYTVTGEIGNGGSGIVYKVQADDGLVFALKAIDPARTTSQRTKRFKNEILFCQKNEHRNIVKVLDWGFISNGNMRFPFYIMPYYPQTLRSLMHHGIAHENIIPIFSQILDGTECAHFLGVVHRDLKPENILYNPSENVLALCDFGIAHFSEESMYTTVETRPSERLANFQYAAPEQRIKGTKVDSRADIYSLGLILNEMFTGRCPSGTGFKKIADVASGFSYLDELVELMMQQVQEARPHTISIIKDSLIARRNEFVVQQKLNELKKQVVPTSEIDDPLVIFPPSLKDVDYRNGDIIFILSCQPSQEWVHSFQNIGNYNGIMGKEPDRFKFSGNHAMISSPESWVQGIVDNFKNYLDQANKDYKALKVSQRRREEEDRRQRLRNQIEEEERRQRVKKSIVI